MIRDIINTYREAFRQWVRTKTRPKTVFEAEEKRLFWSKCYLFSVTCAIGIYIFQSYRENKDNDIPMAYRLARGMADGDSIRVVKYSGFKKVSDTMVNIKDLKKDNTQKEEGTPAPKVS